MIGVWRISLVRWAFYLCCALAVLFIHSRIFSLSSKTLSIRTENENNIDCKKTMNSVATKASMLDNNKTHTVRIGCREYANGGQSCLYSGAACVDVQKKRESIDGPLVFIVDDNRTDEEIVTNDNWCNLRFKSADPKYYGPREWPLRQNLFAPRFSCLKAKFRTSASLFGNINPGKVKWLKDMSLVSLDYVNNDHNYHYLIDIVWLLDVVLWQETMSRSGSQMAKSFPIWFRRPSHVLMPQTKVDFQVQTNRDVNRLNFAIIMQLDPHELYQGDMYTTDMSSRTRFLMDAYPKLKRMLTFYGDELADESVHLICTRRLVVGAKLGGLGSPQVCEHLRRKAWELYSVKEYPQGGAGYLSIAQPPKRLVLLHRHITRSFKNIEKLKKRIILASAKYDFEFEVVSTEALSTAKEQVMFFSRVGVLLTTHGGQCMGGIWMPRHAALIEVFPPGYTDYSFSLLANSCSLWYFELQGVIPNGMENRYRKKCGEKLYSVFDQCNEMKHEDFDADVDQVIRTVLLAFERVGYRVFQQNRSLGGMT